MHFIVLKFIRYGATSTATEAVVDTTCTTNKCTLFVIINHFCCPYSSYTPRVSLVHSVRCIQCESKRKQSGLV